MSKSKTVLKPHYTKSQINKLNKGLCIEKFCRNKHRKNGHICQTCTRHRWREKNPEKYAYSVWKYNCISRGHFFDVTYEQFLTFIEKSNYLELKGTGPLDLCVDRRNNKIGYTISNIRGITMRANSFKRNYHDYKTGKRLTYEEAKELAGTPF